MLEKKLIICKCKRVHEILEPLPEYDYRTPNSKLPTNGIYFFYEKGEYCGHGDGKCKRIVRVGTHRVDGNFRKRIKSHYNGNKNSSVFRKYLGGALIRRKDPNDRRLKQWFKQNTPTFKEIEDVVSCELRKNFTFRCIQVEDREERLCLEEQLIATLSRCSRCSPSDKWLGHYAVNELIRNSGLWNTQHVTSSNILTEKSIMRIGGLIDDNPRDKKALFLIPCCSEKRPNGYSLPWSNVHTKPEANKFQFLDRYRIQMINFYSRLSLEDAFNYYKNRGSEESRNRKVGKAWQKNLRIHKCKTMKAIDRYSGNLYKSLDHSITRQLRNGELDNVLIVSALMGIVAPTDLIPDYELMMMDKSPKNNKIWEFWKETLTAGEVKEHLKQIFSKFDYIYCLMSTATGYVASITNLLSDYLSYCIISKERGQTDKLRSWGRVLSKALSEGAVLPEEIKEVAKMHNCEVVDLNSLRVKRPHYGHQRQNMFGGVKMTQADKIREFVKKNYIEPARKEGKKQITIKAGDVDRKMKLNRVPNVNNVLGGKKLQEECNIKLIAKGGTPGSTTATYTYKILEASEMKTDATIVEKTSQEVKCPKCGYDNDPGNRFCEECGAKLNVCPNCGNEIKITSKFCGKCGAKL